MFSFLEVVAGVGVVADGLVVEDMLELEVFSLLVHRWPCFV